MEFMNATNSFIYFPWWSQKEVHFEHELWIIIWSSSLSNDIIHKVSIPRENSFKVHSF